MIPLKINCQKTIGILVLTIALVLLSTFTVVAQRRSADTRVQIVRRTGDVVNQGIHSVLNTTRNLGVNAWNATACPRAIGSCAVSVGGVVFSRGATAGNFNFSCGLALPAACFRTTPTNRVPRRRQN